MPSSSRLLVTTGFLAAAGLAAAQTLVFDAPLARLTGGNAATSGTNFPGVDLGLGTPGANDFQEILPFGTVTPMWAGTTPSMYGGFNARMGDSAPSFSGGVAWIMRTVSEVPANQLRAQVSPPAGTQNGNAFDGVVFANLGAPINTADIASIYVRTNGGLNSGTPADTGTYHAVIVSGGNLYVSSTSLTTGSDSFAANPAANQLLAPTATATWQPWDFTANSGDNFDVTFDSLDLPPATIDGVGFYYTMSFPTATATISANAIAFGYADFVPEPSAAALLAGLGTLGLVALRRRR